MSWDALHEHLRAVRPIEAASHFFHAFTIDGDPVVGSEVCSSTTLAARSVSDAKLIAQLFGDDDESVERRYKFLDAKMLGEALRLIAGTHNHVPLRARPKW